MQHFEAQDCMDNSVCYEHLCGFCTRTEFFVENVTEKCSLQHIDADLPVEALKDKAAGVLGHYVGIRKEVDRKVANNTYLLSMKSEVYNTMDAIDRLQREIISAGDSQDLWRMKALLRIHGLAVDAARGAESQEPPYSVCETCSFFRMRNGKCEHPLHDKYTKLKKTAEKLQKMLESGTALLPCKRHK